MNHRLGAWAGGIFLMMSAGGALGHHSVSANYDAAKTIELKGVLVDFQIRSPHSTMVVETTNPDGSKKRWQVESRSLSQMRRMGWLADTFHKGDPIALIANPSRIAGGSAVFGVSFTTRDGKVLGAGAALENAQPAPPPPVKLAAAIAGSKGFTRIAGRWRAARRGPMPPMLLTAAGETAQQAYDPKTSPATTCEPLSIPAAYYAPGYLYDIRFNGNKAVLKFEVYELTRTIALGAKPQEVDAAGLLGLEAARVEGERLIIESSAFPASKWGLAIATFGGQFGTDLPSSNRKKVTETYSVSADGSRLRVDYVLEDPVYLTKPYAHFAEFERVTDETPLFDYKCDLTSATHDTRMLPN